jgi:hypothetical protein
MVSNIIRENIRVFCVKFQYINLIKIKLSGLSVKGAYLGIF